MKISDVVREIAAQYSKDEITDDMMEHIVWGHTGYPVFWNIPADGNTPEECFKKQLHDYFKDPVAAEKKLDECLDSVSEAFGGEEDSGPQDVQAEAPGAEEAVPVVPVSKG